MRHPEGQFFSTAAIERVADLVAWRMPVATRLLTWFANACKLLELDGPPPTTLEGLVALCHPEDRHLLREACDRLLADAAAGRLAVMGRMTVAGRHAWFRHAAEIECGPAGDDVALVGVFQEVSWHRQALQEATEDLKSQVQTERHRLKATASAGIVGVWDWLIPQDVLVWDEVMYRLYGLKPEDFGGAFEAWSSAVHPEDKDGAAEAVAAALRGEREYEYVFRVVWPSDGSTHFIKAGGHTIFDDSGKAVRMVGVNHEVTEQIVREAELKEATRVAIEANLAKSEFLARMSHEIRTPMNAVIGLAAMGMDLPDLPHRAAEYMARIHHSSVALMGILNAILDFSKIEARQMELDPQVFELEALIDATSELFTLSAQQKGLRLLTDVDPALPRFVVGDALKLGQILNNLVGNAIKFTDSGQISLRVRRLASSSEADHPRIRLEFTVQDTGIGIAPDNLGELFLPFSQANGSISRRYGGSGLGLVISQRLCEMMGSRIQVNSQPGVGSRFSFELELPVAQDRPVSREQQNLSHRRVLVVDGVTSKRQVIVQMLEGWHVDVEEAASGAEAIEQLSRSLSPTGKAFDLVLLDWDMPRADGREVARWIRQGADNDPLHRKPALLIMAAAPDRERVMRQAGNLDVEKLLIKPINASRLLRALNAALNAAPSGASPQACGSPWQAQRLRAAPMAGAQVLLVEDTADSQLVAADMLERLGLRVTVATNGQQALEVLEGTPVDIVLMDLHMPVMGGLQAARLIRAQPKLGAVPILAMTAAALPQDRADCAAAGMVEVITKPIDPEVLLDALLRWVKPRITASAAPAEAPRKRNCWYRR